MQQNCQNLILWMYVALIFSDYIIPLCIPAHDNDVSAGAGPLGLAEEVYQREYG